MIHVAAAGQFDNIGDTMHRRVLLEWLRPHGELCIYVGDAPDSFLSGLGLRDGDRVFRSIGSWLSTVSLCRTPKPILAFSSGQMKLGRRRAFGEIGLYPLVRAVRAAGGEVLRIGVGTSSTAPFENKSIEWIIRQGVAATTLKAWRTEATQDLFGGGVVIPDLAFADTRLRTSDAHTRDLLVVSMRSDRPLPPPEWTAGLREAASGRDLKLYVVSQVRRDNPRTEYLAGQLGCEPLTWDDKVDHFEQEMAVREVYSRSRVTVSDRLHALIAAATEGSVPVGMVTKSNPKIGQHFDVVGLKISHEVAGLTARDIADIVWSSIENETHVRDKILLAQDRLDVLRQVVTERL